MIPVLISIAVLVATLLVVIFIQSRTGPSTKMLQDVRETILQLQKQAATNILRSPEPDKVMGFDEDIMRKQTAHVRETIRFVYTIDEQSEGLVHTISSQMLRSRPAKYQIQCMLFAILTLNEQLKDAGLDPKTVPFDVSQSELGTHYVSMLVTPAQQAAILPAA